MGLYDRDYTREGFQDRFGKAPQMRMTFPRLTTVVKRLLIINVVVFFIETIFFPNNIIVPNLPQPINFLERWFSVFPYSFGEILQLWRLVTYQFLHGGLIHILFNMIGLFFLGPMLENHWGSRRFLIFYLGCGVAGGLLYVLLASVGFLSVGPMIGASGSILGMLAACAILFPHLVVFIFILPVPIRVAAIILIFIASATILSRGWNAGGEAAHLGGMAAGAIYVFSQSRRRSFTLKVRSKKWERKAASQRRLQVELDRILQKVHESGIQSLTSKEKRALKKATKSQQMRDK